MFFLKIELINSYYEIDVKKFDMMYRICQFIRFKSKPILRYMYVYHDN